MSLLSEQCLNKDDRGYGCSLWMDRLIDVGVRRRHGESSQEVSSIPVTRGHGPPPATVIHQISSAVLDVRPALRGRLAGGGCGLSVSHVAGQPRSALLIYGRCADADVCSDVLVPRWI